MKITFLEAANKQTLTKQFRNDSVTNYPLIKDCSSIEENVTSLSELRTALVHQSKLGRAMLKGSLSKTLVKESRRGHTNRQKPTQLLVIDIDNYDIAMPVPNVMTKGAFKTIANHILNLLPSPLDTTDCLIQASSSLGIKPSVSLHLFMIMDKEVEPSLLKNWLKSLNFEVPEFKEQLKLSSNKQALSWIVDPCIADNSRIIYIASPEFYGDVKDPFADPEDRFLLIDKNNPVAKISKIISNANVESVHTNTIETRDALRAVLGLQKTRVSKKGYEVIEDAWGDYKEVLPYPDKMSIQIVDDTYYPFIRCNVNAGDSNAYYFFADNPKYMYNFKDEPIFEIQKANAQFFAEIVSSHEAHMQRTNTFKPRPVLLAEHATSIFWGGMYDPNTNSFMEHLPLAPKSIPHAAQFMRQHGGREDYSVTEALSADIVFDPTSDKQIDMESVPIFINRFKPSIYMSTDVKPLKQLQYGQAKELQLMTPTVYSVLFHMLGYGDIEYERFVNWLAYIFQTRQKTKNAWVLTGTQGTGKGVFYNKILSPLFGRQYTPMRTVSNIEEQFNDYMETALFLVVDEFSMKASSGVRKVQDKLKNAITEPYQVVRRMRQEQMQVPSYTNFIFLTNRSDAVSLEEGDRRYTVGTYQHKKLPQDVIDNIDKIEKELDLFAAVLKTFKYDYAAATTCYENEAKREMHIASMTDVENFAYALKVGDMTNILEMIMEMNPAEDNFNAGFIISMQKKCKALLAKIVNDEFSIISCSDARNYYNILCKPADKLTDRAFGIKVQTVIKPKTARIDGKTQKGYDVTWSPMAKANAQTMIDSYYDDIDSKTFLTAG